MSLPLTIDGSQGEGGGQILRTSLSLRFRTSAPTDHTTTNAAVIAAFLGERVTLRELGPHDWQVQVRGP